MSDPKKELYNCTNCNITFKDVNKYNQHVNTTECLHNRKKILCDVCGKGFTTDRALATHKLNPFACAKQIKKNRTEKFRPNKNIRNNKIKNKQHTYKSPKKENSRNVKHEGTTNMTNINQNNISNITQCITDTQKSDSINDDDIIKNYESKIKNLEEGMKNLEANTKKLESIIQNLINKQTVQNVENKNSMPEKIPTCFTHETSNDEKIINNTNNNCIINTENNVIMNNINNGTINNIQILNFGNEKLDGITEKEIDQILIRYGIQSTVELVDLIHFNPKYPENHNVYIPNSRGRYASCHIGGIWENRIKGDVVHELYEQKTEIVTEHYEKIKATLKPTLRLAMDKWLNQGDPNGVESTSKDKIIMKLLNKRDMVIEQKNKLKKNPT